MTDDEKKLLFKTTKRTNFLNDNYKYLKNVSIVEWDIHSAGLSVIKFRKLLPENEIKKLESLDKHSRTVQEGLIQKNRPDIAERIILDLQNAISAFAVLNNIPVYNILAIKKDAIFLINSPVETTTIKDYFQFRRKGTYSSYINLNSREFYFNSASNQLDIKGISKENQKLQENFLLKDIKGFLKSAEKVTQDVLFNLLQRYREAYLERRLPIETYRELDSGVFNGGKYSFKEIRPEMIEHIDISQNYLNYILPLIQLLL